MKKRIVALLLLLMMLFGAVSASAAVPTEFITKVFYQTGSEVYWWNAPYSGITNTFDFKQAHMESDKESSIWEKEQVFLKIENTNKKVALVKLIKDGGFQLIIRKPGTTKLIYEKRGVVRQETIEVLKYENPCVSLKIGGKQYASKFNKSPIYSFSGERLVGKISVKPAGGWKLASIRVGKTKYVKNGKKINISQDGVRQLYITFQKKNSRKGCTIEIWLDSK